MGSSTNEGTVEEGCLVCVCDLLLINLNLTRSIYGRDDAKTVSIVALACFHPHVKVQSAAIHFFLGDEDEDDEGSEDEDNVSSELCALFVTFLINGFPSQIRISEACSTSVQSQKPQPAETRSSLGL